MTADSSSNTTATDAQAEGESSSSSYTQPAQLSGALKQAQGLAYQVSRHANGCGVVTG